MALFETEEKLKDIILEILKNNAEKSINQIHRELMQRQDAGSPHRLMVTGYLQALADMGILSEKKVPPAKVYALSPTYRRDIYSALKRIIDQKGYEGERAVEVYAYILNKIFKRPVLEDELLFANFTNFNTLKVVTLSQEERREITQRMRRMKYNVEADRAFLPNRNHEEEMQEILSMLLLEDYGVKILSMERKTKQGKLQL
ncbi:MAG: hypothetical protein N3F63_06125 [Thermoplasmata archaeon]|nr:hypothetical protein [Thermoplasmata archaeon]